MEQLASSNKMPIGCSDAHNELIHKLSKVAQMEIEVLISGPTGIGKELYAHFVHSQSARKHKMFVPINCGTLSDDLLENAMFGHVGGAFTGASVKKEGLVEEAEGGTLFLDEVDALSISCQIKLLRFVQEREFRRLGETRLRKANIRIIAATNTPLAQAVQEGRFREDLFFRLRVAPITVPPLRERVEDLVLLVNIFTKDFAETYQVPRIHLSDAAMERITSYSWPGNVRELENCIRYLTCLQLNREVKVGDLCFLDDGMGSASPHEASHSILKQPFGGAKRDLIRQFERQYVENALVANGGNISKAARASKKARRAFFELMRKNKVSADEFRLS